MIYFSFYIFSFWAFPTLKETILCFSLSSSSVWLNFCIFTMRQDLGAYRFLVALRGF